MLLVNENKIALDGSARQQTELSQSDRVGESQRVPALDGLRGFAIISVVLFHYINNQLPAASNRVAVFLREVTSFGWAGVDLFFVLSGFLLTDVALKRCRCKNFLFVFTVRRFLRVFPAFLVFLVLYAAITQFPPFSTSSFLSGEQTIPFWSYFTLLHNNYMAFIGHMGNPALSVTWSLAVEEQFYVVLPLLVIMLRPRSIVYALAVGTIMAILFRSLHSDWIFRYVLLPCRLDSIAIGGLAACLTSGAIIPFDATKVLRYATMIIVAGLAIVAVAWTIFGDLGVLKHSLLACICAALILIVSFSPNNFLTVIFRQAWLRFFGLISYSLYLIHYFVLGSFHSAFSGREYIGIVNSWDVAVSVLALACSTVIATASRHYFEKPFIDYGRRLHYH